MHCTYLSMHLDKGYVLCHPNQETQVIYFCGTKTPSTCCDAGCLKVCRTAVASSPTSVAVLPISPCLAVLGYPFEMPQKGNKCRPDHDHRVVHRTPFWCSYCFPCPPSPLIRYIRPYMPSGSSFMRNPPPPLDACYPLGVPEEVLAEVCVFVFFIGIACGNRFDNQRKDFGEKHNDDSEVQGPRDGLCVYVCMRFQIVRYTNCKPWHAVSQNLSDLVWNQVDARLCFLYAVA